jgi:hypothetical protein
MMLFEAVPATLGVVLNPLHALMLQIRMAMMIRVMKKHKVSSWSARKRVILYQAYRALRRALKEEDQNKKAGSLKSRKLNATKHLAAGASA